MLKVSKHRKAAGLLSDVKAGLSLAGPAAIQTLKDIAVPVAATAATTIGIPMVAGWVQDRAVARAAKQHQADLVNSYHGMMEVHPTLKERDPTKVQRMFHTLSRVNPTLASDANAAGAYIRRALDEDHLDTGAGTIALVDMASRFDPSKSRIDMVSRINPMLRAERVQSILMDAKSDYNKGKEKAISNLRLQNPQLADQMYGPDPVAVADAKRKAEQAEAEAKRQAERAEDRAQRERMHQERLALLNNRGRRP